MEGRSVLLLHGVQSSRTTWWRAEQDLTELGWRVVALDLPGHGGRPAGDAPLTVARLAADVAERQTCPVDLVVGHSLGAVVALALARARPDLVGAVVLEDPPGLAGDLDARDVADEVERDSALARRDPRGARDRMLHEQPMWSPLDAEHATTNRERLDDRAVAALLRRDPWDLQALVRDCPVPVGLLVADSPESALQGPDLDALLATLPPERIALIRSGHGIHRDRPALWLHHVLRLDTELKEAR